MLDSFELYEHMIISALYALYVNYIDSFNPPPLSCSTAVVPGSSWKHCWQGDRGHCLAAALLPLCLLEYSVSQLASVQSNSF